MKTEWWKPVAGYEGIYWISSWGRVKNRHGRILRNIIHKNGYLFVSLYKNGKGKHFFVHRLVAEAFIPNPNNYPIINHKDETRSNNFADNLEWCDHTYNMNYGTAQQRKADKRSKPVYQYDLQGNLIKCWNSFSECDKYGFFHSLIVKCCLGERKTHKGYKWSYYLSINKDLSD